MDARNKDPAQPPRRSHVCHDVADDEALGDVRPRAQGVEGELEGEDAAQRGGRRHLRGQS